MPFNSQDGTGAALSSMFHSWPKGRLAQICGPGGPATPETNICESYYRLGDEELRRAFPLAIYGRLRRMAAGRGADVAMPSAGGGGSQGGQPPLLAARARAALHARGWLYPVDSRLSTGLKKFLDEFAPDLIFSVPGEYAFVRLSRQITSYLQIPVAIQVYDNWMITHYRKGLWAGRKRRRLDLELRALFDSAALRFGISEVMCEAYGATYGQPFLPLSVPVEVDRWHRPLRERVQNPGNLTVVYAGSIHQHAAYAGLADMSRAVERLNRDGMAVKFSIIGSVPASESQIGELGGEFTEFVCLPERTDLIERVGSADLLFLPVAFDAESRQFIKYSLPAKSAAYMASGTPMLVYAPADLPISIEAARHGFAHVVSEPDIEQLAAAARHLLSDAAERIAISDAAVERAKEHYDMKSESIRVR
ncbi:MAG: glycosyltransferase, partial [Rhodospirillaceae bacterium]|nr:glycosyltransferase [Rhodospirillaceae bacterium]